MLSMLYIIIIFLLYLANDSERYSDQLVFRLEHGNSEPQSVDLPCVSLLFYRQFKLLLQIFQSSVFNDKR